MPIEFEVQEPITAPGTGWTGFNTPHSSNVGQTHGPAGMGIGAYMNRPETQPGFKPFTIPRPGYNSAVGTSMQTDGPAGMGMRPYMNRPETQPGFKPFMPPSEFNRMRGYGITNPKAEGLPAIQYRAGLKDWMKDKAWPWMKETGEGMKNQIPYLLDNLIPGYEPPEGYYEPDWEENKDMAGMDDSWQYLQRQIDELNPDSPNYEDQLELLESDMDMKYPWMQMAKVYTNQDPGMIDEGILWDDFTPGAEAINKAYNWMRGDKPLYGSDPQSLRNAIKNKLFEDERMYRNMFPRGILQDLPKDAFENLEDFQNQQPITII